MNVFGRDLEGHLVELGVSWAWNLMEMEVCRRTSRVLAGVIS